MDCAQRLQLDYPRLGDLRQRPGTWWEGVLALVRFDDGESTAPAEIPTADVKTPVLTGSEATAEVWRVDGALQSGQRGRVSFRRNERLLFARVSINESEFAERDDDAGSALRRATGTAYSELFDALGALQCPHPLRIWNILPQINGAVGDGERYWHFNSARRDAFISAGRSVEHDVPAASAVGSQQPSALTVYCIASAQRPFLLESPRQRSAWTYPSQYGPRSPTFSRACIADDAGQALFISGTASIVGHVTVHIGDVREQTRETLRNIRALLAVANARSGTERYALDRLYFKVYVRHAEHRALIDAEMRTQIGAAMSVVYLQADICRRDLLLEIEAVGTPRTA